MVEEKTMTGSGEGLPAQRFRPVNFRGRRWFWRYCPLILWAVLIFIGSTDLLSASNTGGLLRRTLLWVFPHTSDATLNTIHFVVRKTGHFTEYAIFALLAARAFRTSFRKMVRSRWFWASLLLVVVYALGDEFHQSFVPSRGASIYDSMIDSLGGLTALALLAVAGRSKHRRDSPEES
jgi:VanZ family protein